MTSERGCSEAGGTWDENLCSPNDFVYIRPCCGVGDYSTCEIMTENECDFHGGTWQIDQMLCSETLCLADTCQIDKVCVRTRVGCVFRRCAFFWGGGREGTGRGC